MSLQYKTAGKHSCLSIGVFLKCKLERIYYQKVFELDLQGGDGNQQISILQDRKKYFYTGLVVHYIPQEQGCHI